MNNTKGGADSGRPGSLQRMVRRAMRWLYTKLLKHAPLYQMELNKPIAVSVRLLVDVGGPAYKRVEFPISKDTHPWLVDGKLAFVVIEVWEDGDTSRSLYARADLLPDRRDFPLPCNLDPQAYKTRDQSHLL